MNITTGTVSRTGLEAILMIPSFSCRIFRFPNILAFLD